MTTWHLDADHIASYRDGQVGSAFAASIETHLVACETCRELVATTADGDRLDRVWADIVDAVDAPAPTASERILRALRVRPDTARLLAATPSLRLSWLTAVAVVLAMASASAHTGRYGLPLFLALAPVLPVAGVAVSFGRAADPTFEVTVASPYSSTRLLLLRSLAVIITTFALTAAGAALLPQQGATAAAWLLPALALTAGTLALSTRFDPAKAAIVMVVAWFAVSLPALRPGSPPLLATHMVVQVASAVLFAVAVLVLVDRREHLGNARWNLA